MNPVPPRMRMRRGFTDFSASNVMDPALNAKAVPAVVLIKRRRFIRFVMSSGVETSLIFSKATARDSSTSVGKTKGYDETRSCTADWRNGGGLAFAD
jgi:hypothetical protein